jgi:signal peptidase I
MTVASAITGLRRLLDGLLFALVAVSLGVLVLGRVLPMTGHQALVVAGPSMGTAVPIGAAAILDTVPSSSLAVGDVVSLRSGPERAIFTHRVIRLAERDGTLWLETKGDANPTADPSLTSSDAVLGRVGVVIPYAGYLLTLYSAPSGIVFVVSLGMVLLLLGISLEPRAIRTGVATPAHTPDAPDTSGGLARPIGGLTLAPVAEPPIRATERPSTKEAVRASRERRARRSPAGSATPRRRSRA